MNQISVNRNRPAPPGRWSLWLLAGLLALSSCSTRLLLQPEAQAVEKITALAVSLKGAPYRYGGSTPEGFDCSGFVRYVFRQAAGVRLPRTSQAQFNQTLPVSLGQEQPSDLVFFRVNSRGPSHVGIYLGKGRFIHAPSRGRSVSISNANQEYWRRRFVGVRRAL